MSGDGVGNNTIGMPTQQQVESIRAAKKAFMDKSILNLPRFTEDIRVEYVNTVHNIRIVVYHTMDYVGLVRDAADTVGVRRSQPTDLTGTYGRFNVEIYPASGNIEDSSHYRKLLESFERANGWACAHWLPWTFEIFLPSKTLRRVYQGDPPTLDGAGFHFKEQMPHTGSINRYYKNGNLSQASKRFVNSTLSTGKDYTIDTFLKDIAPWLYLSKEGKRLSKQKKGQSDEEFLDEIFDYFFEEAAITSYVSDNKPATGELDPVIWNNSFDIPFVVLHGELLSNGYIPHAATPLFKVNMWDALSRVQKLVDMNL